MMRKLFSLLLILMVLGTLFVSCSVDPRVAPTKLIVVSSVDEESAVVKYSTTSNYREVTIHVDDTLQLDVISNRLDASNLVTWYTSSSCVEVSSSGLVTGKRKGAALVTVAAKSGSARQAVCLIHVEPDESLVQPDLNIILDDEVKGTLYVLGDYNYRIEASSLEELQKIGVQIKWTPEDPDARYQYFLWYEQGNSTPISRTTTAEYTYHFDDWGIREIRVVPFKENVNHDIVGEDTDFAVTLGSYPK